MLMQFNQKIIDKTPTMYNMVQVSTFDSIITYIIDSKYRTSRTLKTWLKEQVDNPSQKLKDFCDSIETNTDYDTQVQNILVKIRSKFIYITDDKVWNMPEKWQTAEESINKMTGDCEDGAILMYCIARIKGVPSNRLTLLTGNVLGGGHCWLGYKPNGYPLNFAFLDWCYWPNLNSMTDRNLFSIIDKNIYEYTQSNVKVKSNYYNIWFYFNEDSNGYKISYDFSKVEV